MKEQKTYLPGIIQPTIPHPGRPGCFNRVDYQMKDVTKDVLGVYRQIHFVTIPSLLLGEERNSNLPTNRRRSSKLDSVPIVFEVVKAGYEF